MIRGSVDSFTLASVLLGNWSIFLNVCTNIGVVNFCGSICFNGTGIDVATLCKSWSKHEHSTPRSNMSEAPQSAPSSKSCSKLSIKYICLLSTQGRWRIILATREQRLDGKHFHCGSVQSSPSFLQAYLGWQMSCNSSDCDTCTNAWSLDHSWHSASCQDVSCSMTWRFYPSSCTWSPKI